MTAALQAVGLLLMIDSSAAYQMKRQLREREGALQEGALVLTGAVLYWLGVGGLALVLP